MPQLGQNRLGRLAACVTGDVENDAFDYRRHVDLDAFFTTVEGAPPWDDDPTDSRNTRALKFVSACNRTVKGESGLPTGIEALLRAMLSLGEFADEPGRDAAIPLVNSIFEGYSIVVETDANGDVQITDSRTGRYQKKIDAELHTALGAVLHESDLTTARVHYTNAQRLLRQDDFANCAKEAVCSVEAFLCTITDESDFKRALRKATSAGLPKPLDGVIEKLYAWRGNEPGVAHGGSALPTVTRADAQFALNMAAAVNLYLRERLVQERARTARGPGA